MYLKVVVRVSASTMLMKSKYQWIITIFAFTVLVVNSIEGFVIHHNVQNNNKLQVLQDSYTFMSRLGMASSKSSSSGNGVESFLQEVHNSGYQFRLVVSSASSWILAIKVHTFTYSKELLLIINGLIYKSLIRLLATEQYWKQLNC